MQWILAVQWLCRSTPDLNRLLIPLQDMFVKAMKVSTSRKKSAANKLLIAQFGWTEVHNKAYDAVNRAISRKL
jgi:hypothetical protein